MTSDPIDELTLSDYLQGALNAVRGIQAPAPHHPRCTLVGWQQECNCLGDYCCEWPIGHAGECRGR